MLLPLASIDLPPGAGTIRLTITPVLPAVPASPGLQMDGNTYRFTATVASGPVGLKSGHSVRITLRHTGAPGRPTMALLEGGRWVLLHSVESASGTSTADSPMLGQLVLMLSTGHSSGLGAPLTAALIVLGVLVILALVLLILGRKRRAGVTD
jgi:hypothetical protein